MPAQVSTYYIDHNLDRFDHMSIDLHRHVTSSHSGKGRTKREASAHTNRPDPCGHCRKPVTKLVNNSHKHRAWAVSRSNCVCSTGCGPAQGHEMMTLSTSLDSPSNDPRFKQRQTEQQYLNNRTIESAISSAGITLDCSADSPGSDPQPRDSGLGLWRSFFVCFFNKWPSTNVAQSNQIWALNRRWRLYIVPTYLCWF